MLHIFVQSSLQFTYLHIMSGCIYYMARKCVTENIGAVHILSSYSTIYQVEYILLRHFRPFYCVPHIF
jgi:hypothetical protein